MALKSILATIIVFSTFVSVHGQSTDPAAIAAASTLGGTYIAKAACVDCESIITKLKLTSEANTDGGTFVLTKMDQYRDASIKITEKSDGKWYLLQNKVPGDNTTIIVVDINYAEEPETYPLFMVKPDGSLLQLNQQFIERYPEYLFKDKKDNELYIARQGGKPLALKKTLHYKDAEKNFADPTVDHIFKKQ